MRIQQGSEVNYGIVSVWLLGTLLILTAGMMFGGYGVLGAAADTVEFVLDQASFTSQGVTTVMDVAPFAEGGRTFVPVRYLAQGLGIGDDGIAWNGARQEVTLRKGSTTLVLVIGNKSLSVNGKTVMMDTAPLIRESRTFLPARFVAEALGNTVSYVESTRTVVIRSAAAQTYAVEIRNFAFSPASLTIKKGDSVTWTNRDGAAHSIEMNGVESDLMQTGQSYTRAFNETGTFSYRCGPHPSMLGTIIVE